VIMDTTPTIAGQNAAVTVQAQDNSGNLATDYSGSVTLHASGIGASTGGIVPILHSVGSINILDLKAESVALSLEDTASTSLDVSSTNSISFIPGPTAKFIMAGANT